jgi:mannose-6-phosphate isomerase-like protein (cupin superfamily)
MEPVNLADRFRKFHDYRSPKIVGELNDSYVKIAKLKGEFVWHHHPDQDELFLVIKGHLTIKLRGGK